MPFNEARAFAQSLSLKNRAEWKSFFYTDSMPYDIPYYPDRIYANQGWISLGDWLGTGTIAPQLKTYKEFNDAKTFVHGLKLPSQREWQKYSKSGMRPVDIPSDPFRAYQKEKVWEGWGDWLGTFKQADSKRSFLPFKEARNFARTLKLKNWEEWRQYSVDKKIPDNVPANPHHVYKDKGWVSMGDWLDTGRIANQFKSFTNYKNASKFAASLNLKSKSEWRTFLKSGKKPSNIPSIPEEHYKDNGWISWPHWLGTSK
jgi:hypothetical protein